ncbi:MAG: tetratricopeptide repeat protein [Selenomonadaceae bacterium]|nr:tetratricopeptide repeat protein [Selenomonadaceae bacterium]
MKKILAATLIIGSMFFSSIGNAEIKTYTATSEEVADKFEAQEVVKLRARDKAIKIALTEAGNYLKSNSELTDDEISAITSNSFELVGLPQYNRTDKSSTWSATVEIKIDDAEIKNWLNRDERDKHSLINQTKDTQKLFAANDLRLEEFRTRAKNSSKQERNQLKAAFGYVDKEFLSNQKVADGNKFYYKGRFDDAIKLYTEALELNEDNVVACNLRGNIYGLFAMNQKNIPVAESNRRQALADLDKALRLNPNYADAYGNRGFVYYGAKNFSAAIKDFDKAIQLNPNDAQNYTYRGFCYRQTDVAKAAADFDKAVELLPNNPSVYFNRGNFYEHDVKDFSKAVQDYSRAIDLTTREDLLAVNYQNRGDAYRKLNMFGKAIEDYTRAIEFMEKPAQKNPLLPWVYRSRGECYRSLGDGANAQADLNKFAELQRR